jgi:hypothetical protein
LLHWIGRGGFLLLLLPLLLLHRRGGGLHRLTLQGVGFAFQILTPADEAARLERLEECGLADLGRPGLEHRRLMVERVGVAFQAVHVVRLGMRQSADTPGQAAHIARLFQQIDDLKFGHALLPLVPINAAGRKRLHPDCG